MELHKRGESTKSQEKLESFHKCISGLVEPVSEECVYHYTTIDALFNGVLRRDTEECDKRICLRASNALYMTDTSEIQTGYEFMQQIISDHFIKLDDKEGFDNLKDVVATYFLSSFSLQRDVLPMWRMYAKNATGVALCFDFNLLRENCNGELLKCVYLTDDVASKIRRCLQGMTSVNMSSEALVVMLLVILIGICKSQNQKDVLGHIHPYLRLVSALKHKAYIAEDEVRFVQTVSDGDIKFRLKDNKFVPYIEQYFPKEVLTEIIVGPNNDMPRTMYSLQTYLKHIGFDHVKVTASDIPYKD